MKTMHGSLVARAHEKMGLMVIRSGHSPTGWAGQARGGYGVGHTTRPPGPPLAGHKPGREWLANTPLTEKPRRPVLTGTRAPGFATVPAALAGGPIQAARHEAGNKKEQ